MCVQASESTPDVLRVDGIINLNGPSKIAVLKNLLSSLKFALQIQVRYWDEAGNAHDISRGSIRVLRKADSEGRVYYMLRFPEAITAKLLIRVVFLADRIHRVDSLLQLINGIHGHFRLKATARTCSLSAHSTIQRQLPCSELWRR